MFACDACDVEREWEVFKHKKQNSWYYYLILDILPCELIPDVPHNSINKIFDLNTFIRQTKDLDWMSEQALEQQKQIREMMGKFEQEKLN